MSLPTKNARPSKIKDDGTSTTQTIGQCFSRSASDGGINEILITPLLNNSISVLETLTHELVHAIDDCQHGHKTPFKRIAEAVGLEGKMTNTIAGEELTEKIKAIVKKLGRYPHKKLNLNGAKQGTRLILIQDFYGCGAKMRVSRKVIDDAIITFDDASCPFCGSEGTLIEGKVENCEGEVDEVTLAETERANQFLNLLSHWKCQQHIEGWGYTDALRIDNYDDEVLTLLCEKHQQTIISVYKPENLKTHSGIDYLQQALGIKNLMPLEDYALKQRQGKRTYKKE